MGYIIKTGSFNFPIKRTKIIKVFYPHSKRVLIGAVGVAHTAKALCSGD